MNCKLDDLLFQIMMVTSPRAKIGEQNHIRDATKHNSLHPCFVICTLQSTKRNTEVTASDAMQAAKRSAQHGSEVGLARLGPGGPSLTEPKFDGRLPNAP